MFRWCIALSIKNDIIWPTYIKISSKFSNDFRFPQPEKVYLQKCNAKQNTCDKYQVWFSSGKQTFYLISVSKQITPIIQTIPWQLTNADVKNDVKNWKRDLVLCAICYKKYAEQLMTLKFQLKW